MTMIVVYSSLHPNDIAFSGFDVAKTGDARIGFVGKSGSTLLY